MNLKIQKKSVRTFVKTAVSLYNQDEISKDILFNIAETALAWEIMTGLQEKLNRKATVKNNFSHRIENISE